MAGDELSGRCWYSVCGPAMPAGQQSRLAGLAGASRNPAIRRRDVGQMAGDAAVDCGSFRAESSLCQDPGPACGQAAGKEKFSSSRYFAASAGRMASASS